MLHVLHSLRTTLRSRVKIRNLEDLLTKTNVDVITPFSSRSSINIISRVKDEFRRRISNPEIEADLSIIEAKVEEIDALIDAKVFQIYRLDENEAAFVMSNLGMEPTHQQTVLNRIRRKE